MRRLLALAMAGLGLQRVRRGLVAFVKAGTNLVPRGHRSIRSVGKNQLKLALLKPEIIPTRTCHLTSDHHIILRQV